MLLQLLTLALPLAAALPQQQPLIAADPAPDLSAELFRSVHGLLKSWSQAFQPIGRSIVPAIIPGGTLLYHGRGDARPPTSGIDWFALDAEHAYMFASRGPDSALNTYVATRPLKVLYFDGFSASKGNPGSQDLQKLIAFGHGQKSGTPRFEDGLIAEGLCRWGAKHGIEGFVREEATFEVIWCDFGQNVKLLHSVNTTRDDWANHGPPGSRPGPPPPSADMSSALGSQLRELSDEEPIRPGPQRPSQWQLLTAASWHYFSRDPRVQLSTGYISSLSDPKYTSLWHIYDLPVHQRSLMNMSSEDLAVFKAELEENIRLWHTSGCSTANSDYLGIVDVIVDRTGGRLARLQASFDADKPSESVERMKAEVVDILFPYLDVPSTLWQGDGMPDARTRHNGIQHAVSACTTAYTSFTDKYTALPSELLLSQAVEGVLRRLCAVSGDILEDSLSLHVRAMNLSEGQLARHQLKTAESWKRKIDALVNWLDWPIWRNCKNACKPDEICYMPMWPVLMEGADKIRYSPPPDQNKAGVPQVPQPIQEPRCVKRD